MAIQDLDTQDTNIFQKTLKDSKRKKRPNAKTRIRKAKTIRASNINVVHIGQRSVLEYLTTPSQNQLGDITARGLYTRSYEAKGGAIGNLCMAQTWRKFTSSNSG